MKKFSLLIVLILLLVGGIGAWFVTAIAPIDVSDKTQHLFVVNQGEGIREIATKLKAEGFINSPIAFFLIVKQLGLDNNIQAGDFRLSKNMTTQQVAENLTKGSLDVWITFPEGIRADEIADILKKELPSYDESWRAVLNEHEGYLFPDTYLIPNDATVDQFVSILTNNFEKKYATVPTQTKKITKQELVTIASLVEREARLQKDRPLVASVIFNRLTLDMGLDLDATVQYAIGNETKWWPQLTASPKTIAPESPYNTYIHAGLPPTPISNPGLEALTAVATAPETNYLFYITDPKTGKNVYAKTLSEQNANIKKYGL